jgi:hypothetical protein
MEFRINSRATIDISPGQVWEGKEGYAKAGIRETVDYVDDAGMIHRVKHPNRLCRVMRPKTVYRYYQSVRDPSKEQQEQREIGFEGPEEVSAGDHPGWAGPRLSFRERLLLSVAAEGYATRQGTDVDSAALEVVEYINPLISLGGFPDDGEDEKIV